MANVTAEIWAQVVQPDGKLHSAQPIDVTPSSVPVISVANATASGFQVNLLTASVDVQSGIDSYVLEYSTVGTNGPWQQFGQPKPNQFPYVWSGGSASRNYWVRAKAIDGAGNASATSAIQTITTSAASGSGIQLTFGHWVTVDRGSGQNAAQQLAFIRSLASEPLIVGVVLAASWGEYDGGTTGPNYTKGDQLVDQWIAACQDAGKKLIIRADWSKFSASTPSGPLGCCPAYFVQNSASLPSYTLRPAGATWAGNLATSVCYWYGPTMDAFIALIQHLAARYGANPIFEGFRFSETANAAPSSVGHTTDRDITQWKRLILATRTAVPTKEISIAGNYLGSDSNVLDLTTAGIASKVMCTAGPDSGPQRAFQFNSVFCGYLNGSKTGNTDYRGTFPNISESQYPNEASGGNQTSTTPSVLYNWQLTGDPSIGGAMNPNKFIWQQNTWTGPNGTYFTWPAVLAFIKSINGACNRVRPAGY